MSESWPETKLGSFVDVVAGHAFKSADFAQGDEHVRLLRGDNIGQGIVRWDGAKRWSLPVAERWQLQADDVVIAMDRPWIDAGLKWAWIRSCDMPSYLVQRVARLRANPGLDQRFLRYIIGSPDFTAYISPIVTGATVPHISGGQIENFKFRLPPLPIQRKISGVLSAYDDLIENNTRRIALLEEMAQALYREWFVEFRFPGHETAEFVEDEQGRRPKGWEQTHIGHLALVVTRGIAPKYSDEGAGVVVNQKCIRSQRLTLTPARKHVTNVPSAKTLRFGDVLINSTGVGTLGRVAQVYQDLDAHTVDSHVTIVRPDDTKTNHDFFGLALLGMQEHFEAAGVGATGQTELGRERVSATPLVLPPLGMQQHFSSLVEPARLLVETLSSRNSNLRRTRDLLLPRLISGEVDVSDLDIRLPGETPALLSASEDDQFERVTA